jgi:hypothetical protein
MPDSILASCLRVKLLAPLLIFLAAASGVTQGTDAPGVADWKIHLEFHAVTLPEKQAYALLPDLRDEAKMPDAWAKLEALIASGGARIAANQNANAVNNEEVTLSTGEEIRYPADFNPAKFVEKREAAPKKPNKAKNSGVAVPVDHFEARRVGITLVSHLRVSDDGKRLIVSSKAEHCWLLSWDEFEVGRFANNEKILIKQPRFTSAKIENTFGIFSGERVLLSSHAVPGGEETELLLLRVWTTPRKQGE